MAEKVIEEATKVLALVEAFSIETNDTYRQALQLAAGAKKRLIPIEEQRKVRVAPLNAQVKEVNGAFTPAIKAYEKAEKVLKSKLGTFKMGQEARRSQLLSESAVARKAGDTERANELLEEAETLLVPELPGLSNGAVWTGTITDVDKIPRKYMMPDLKALKTVTKDGKVDPKIPGWAAHPEPSVSITVSKVEL